jgi:hypothetical protein
MVQEANLQAELNRIMAEIKKVSDTFVFAARDIVLHFQTLTSARASRMLMEAPGLYYPDMDLYVISRSGMNYSIIFSRLKRQPAMVLSCIRKVLSEPALIRSCEKQQKISRRNCVYQWRMFLTASTTGK